LIIVNTIQSLLILGFTFSFTVIAGGLIGRYGGLRIWRVNAVPVGFGVLFAIAMMAMYLDEIGESYGYFSHSKDRLGIGLGTAFAGLLATDFLWRVVVREILRRLSIPYSSRPSALAKLKLRISWEDVATVVVVVVAFPVLVIAGRTVGLGGGGEALEAEVEAKSQILASYPLPGAPTDMTMVGSHVGYAVLVEGQVVRFELPETPEQEFKVKIVADGLIRPHGVTTLDGSLFVTEQGPSPCPQLSPKLLCHFGDFKSMSKIDAEVFILSSWRGTVVGFDIAADGSLENRRTVIDDIPVVNSEHAINGIRNGGDGWLYMSIGGYDVSGGLLERPEAYLDADIPKLELVGTITRFRPDGSEVEVFTRGLRNVFGIAVADDGSLLAIDNDGQSGRGDYRAEEVVVLAQGNDHRWPYEGTYTQPSERTGIPIGVIDRVGSAGIEWAERAGLEMGLLVGGIGRVDHVLLGTDESGYFTIRKLPRVVVEDLPPSYITALVGIGSGQVLAASYGLGLEGAGNGLLLLDAK